jgi:hypothetical protein
MTSWGMMMLGMLLLLFGIVAMQFILVHVVSQEVDFLLD